MLDENIADVSPQRVDIQIYPTLDRFGAKKGFGTKLKGEIFEVADEVRALEIIAFEGAEELKEIVSK